MARPRFALIPTNGRPVVKECIAAIEPQVDRVVLVAGGPNLVDESIMDWPIPVIRDEELNISKWWNQGMDYIHTLADVEGHKKWDVAILNDDTIVPAGWMDAVTLAMRETGAVAGCSGGTAIPHRILHKEPGPVGLTTRMKGFGFVLAGEKGVRANEQLRWWWSDDHVDWLSRKLGGMVMVPGFGVEHLYPNQQMTGELHEMSAEDAAKFVAYWGQRPW